MDDAASSQRSDVFMLIDTDGIAQDLSELQNSAQSSQRSEDVKRWLQVMKENEAIRHHIPWWVVSVFMLTDTDGISRDLSELQNSAQSSQRSEDVKRRLQVMKENEAIRDHIQ
ncbi:unnamed protein product [Pocillopora meandrina]|uniref:Uncharacterized protein n=1 Tax=Pocillopora meandrina TaxID=46732 RepID=A0AAU9W8X9_9CNID|nr:unnamed protein product [Pocillopora meandrina]